MADLWNFLERNRFLFKILKLIALVSTSVCFANAKDVDLIEEPSFEYLEGDLLNIRYVNGANRTLRICCNASNVEFRSLDQYLVKLLMQSSCGKLSLCDNFTTWSTCTTHEQEVYCQVQMVFDSITLKSYVARIEQNEEVLSSKIATFVANKSEMVPRSVTNLTVIANSKRGLNISWKCLTKREYTISQTKYYTQKVDCHPLENDWAKAVSKDVDILKSYLTINENDISGASKYRCCVQVVNGLTSGSSSPLCANVTTSEQAPSSPPVIICGNDTACPYVVKGTKRNITIKFLLPAKETRNGKIMRHELYYKNAGAANTTKLIIFNGSVTEAVIPGAETGVSYDVFMRSGNEVGFSPISNTVRIPSVSNHKKNPHPTVEIVAGVASVFLIVLFGIVFFLARHRRRQNPLPKLEQPTNMTAYEYPDIDYHDDNYHELEEKPSDNHPSYKIDFRATTVIVNPTVQAAVQA